MERFLMVQYFLSIANREVIKALIWEKVDNLDSLYLMFNSKGVNRIIEMALDTKDTSLKEILSAADEAYGIIINGLYPMGKVSA